MRTDLGMNAIRLCLALLLGTFLTTVVLAREWASASGKFSTEAELVEVKNGNVLLKTSAGKVISIPLQKLRAADQEFIKATTETKPEEPTDKTAPALPPAELEKRRQIAELAAAASMMYARNGSIRNSVVQQTSNAKQVRQLAITDERANSAREAYLAVLSQYQTGLDYLAGKNVRPGDVGELKDAFLAGLTGDEEMQDEVIENIGDRLGEIEEHRQVGLAKVAAAERQHERFWQQDLLPLIKDISGPQVDQPGLEISAVRSATTAKSGLTVKNTSGQPLHNLCLAVNSKIGFAGLNDSTNYVFIEKLDAQQQIMLSWRLAGALIQPDSNPQMGNGITLSVWSTQFTVLDQELTLPADLRAIRKTKKARNGLQWVPFRIKLSAPGEAP